MIVQLFSVASVIDTDTMIVYAMYSTGNHLYDPDSGRSLDQCSKEWFRILDEWDRLAISEIKYQKQLTRH
jgi:hypothetical protein